MTFSRFLFITIVVLNVSVLHSQSAAKINEDQDAPRVMIYCAENGFLEPVKSMVARGVDVNIHDVNDYSALAAASSLGHKDIVSFLISKGGDKRRLKPLEENFQDITPVPENTEAQIAYIFAVRWGIDDMVRFFIDKGISVDTVDSSGSSALTVAAVNNHVELVKYLIGKKADLNLLNGVSHTPLDQALIDGSAEGAALIALAGGRMQSEDIGWYEKKLHAVLIKKDSNLEEKNPYDDMNLIMYAAQRNHSMAIRYLAKRGADINVKYNSRQMRNRMINGSTPIILALRDNGGLDAAYELIRLKASLDDLNNTDETALLIAVYHADIDLVRALLDAGANVNRADSFGKTPYYFAKMNSDADMMKLLKSRGGK
jgi:ankyrin repeat protein